MAKTKHAWYDIVEDGTLLQGDILSECQVLLPSMVTTVDAMILSRDPKPSVPLQIIAGDLIIMSQSCDIKNDKTPLVVVCPVFSLTKLAEAAPSEWKRSNPEEEATDKKVQGWLKTQVTQTHRRDIISRYMIPPIEHRKIKRGLRFVDFGHTFSVMYPDLQAMAHSQKQWLRIKSPYREHLSQAFGIFFMRVALTTRIDDRIVKEELGKLKVSVS